MPSSNKMRIGIFGGAFDPPHLGHERAVRAFLEKAELDLLYVIPSGNPPHKVISEGASSLDRLEMSRRAFLPISEKIVVSDREILADGTCYSFLTVEKIRKEHPESEIFLFVGTDQFLVFETWRKFHYLLEMCTLCVMDRFEDFSRINEKKAQLEKDFGAHLLLLDEKAYIISSTDIRAELRESGFSDSLSPAVNEWITLSGIYSSLSDPVRRELIERLREALSPGRFSHTLSVERQAVRLCRLLSLSAEDTREMAYAALYHDLAKEWTREEMLSFLRSRGEQISEEDESIPAVLHGRVAALLAQESGILSEDAIHAIRFHTTGRQGMSLKEKILYFADFTEEMRKQRACCEMRVHFDSQLPCEEKDRLQYFDRCVLAVMENTAHYLKENNIPTHSLGAAALADMKIKNRKEFS